LASTEQIPAWTAGGSARWIKRVWIALVALVLAATLLGHAQGGAMWLGLLLGAAAAARVAVLLDALRPIAALITAIRPLALPPLLILAAGTVESLSLQLTAGIAAMLVAWHVLIRPAPCYTLTIRCDDGDAPCAQGAPNPALEPRRAGAAYVRVVRKRQPPTDGSPNPFEHVARLSEQPTVLAQYWYFYPYDEWVSPVLAGQLRQRHEGDWEAVTIGFSDRAPLFVGFSQHCGGQWYPWKDVRVQRDGTRLRPLVAVADGSQANYRYPNPAQAPDWSGCAKLPPKTLTLVSYASNIRDRVAADWSWEPAERRLVDAGDSPMSFVGRWAPFSRTELDTLYRDQVLGPDATGPATPTLQMLWREPLRTIFRTPNWHAGKVS
jgi:hypothetical protein